MCAAKIVDEALDNAVQAAGIFSQFSQEDTDRVVEAVFSAGFSSRTALAKMAVEETKLGIYEDKVIKNTVATLLVYDSISREKTVGIISENFDTGIIEIAQPLGPILAIIPMTNPTSTTLFKILIALKTRNPIIISAHHRAINSCRETVRICYEAALKADAPENCIQFFERGSREDTQELMRDPRLALILATGSGSVVKAAYSSGTPAIGVGAGNVPVFIEKSADIPFSVSQIMLSKTFDNGTVCASEQSLVVEKSISASVRQELVANGAHFLSPAEIKAVEKVAYDSGKDVMNVDIVGKSAGHIASLAGIKIPAGTRVLLAPLGGVGKEWPLSAEILAPILAYYECDDFSSAANLCIDLNFFGGIGHTAAIYSNDEAKIREFSILMNAGRILVNTPSSQGAVGGIYNTLLPSLTLGCGTGGKNITTDNISAKHLLNIQRICRRRSNERFMRLDMKSVMDGARTADELLAEYNKNF